jgi:hypothetical protein
MSTQTNFRRSNIAAPNIVDGRALGTTFRELHLSARQLLIVVFFLIIFTGAARPITDPDFWWHLRTGQVLAETWSIPNADIFSSLHQGKEWVTHEWLSELLIYLFYQSFGYGGLIVTFAIIITAAFFITFRRYRHLVGHPYVAGFALLLGAFSTLPVWGVRPQMFTLLLASVFLAILDQYAKEGKRLGLYWLVPLTILWVNLHAGFALGLGLILLFMVGIALEGLLALGSTPRLVWHRVRPLAIVWLACLVSVLLNPSGPRIYTYPFETIKSQAMMKYIIEWRSPDFHQPMFFPLAILLFATFAALALSRKHVSLKDLLILSVTGLGVLRSARNVPFFALAAIPLLAEHSWAWISTQRWASWLTKAESREEGGRATLKIVLNVLLLMVAPIGLVVTRVAHTASSQDEVNTQQFPAAAVDFMMSQKLPQPFYNEYGWGGYLIWRGYPEYKVYIDGRADVYGDAFMDEFLMTHSGETNWQEPLNRYRIRTVLVDPETSLASLLRQQAEWQKVFEDSQAVIFTRQ